MRLDDALIPRRGEVRDVGVVVAAQRRQQIGAALVGR